MKLPQIAPITFPKTFCVDNNIRYGAAAFSVVSAFTLGLLYSHHDYSSMAKIGVISGAIFMITAAAWSFRLHVDDTGFSQRWLLGKRSATWNDIVRMDQTARSASRGYEIYGENGKELVALSLLSPPAQQAIADEILTRTGLRLLSEKPKPPLIRQWKRI